MNELDSFFVVTSGFSNIKHLSKWCWPLLIAQMFCPFGLHFVLVARLFLSFCPYVTSFDLQAFSASSVFHPPLLQQILLQSDWLFIYRDAIIFF